MIDISRFVIDRSNRLAEAHAMLALAAATAVAGDFGNRAEADAWRRAPVSPWPAD
jgi:hypothetical protein